MVQFSTLSPGRRLKAWSLLTRTAPRDRAVAAIQRSLSLTFGSSAIMALTVSCQRDTAGALGGAQKCPVQTDQSPPLAASLLRWRAAARQCPPVKDEALPPWLQ